jgi:phospholipid/cholesterol/gamma-HCH transport system substrate-binding protein
VSRWTGFRASLSRQSRGRSKDTIAIILLVAAGIVMTLWIFTQQKASLPSWVPIVGEEFDHITGDFTTAQAVTPGQGQAVDIAGIQVGKVTAVDLEDGHAVVGMDIEPKYMELIRPNASLLLRPKTNLNDMVVEVEPGSGKGHIKDGHNFPLSQTEPNVNLDAFLGTLDADTRQYIQLLVAGGAQGIGGRGHQFGNALRRLHRQPQQSGRDPPRGARQRDPRLRPADHRTGSPRRRDRTLGHLLQGGARQLRQPAELDPGNPHRIPLHPDRGRIGVRQRRSLLQDRPPGPARPDPAGAGAEAGAEGQPAALRTDR